MSPYLTVAEVADLARCEHKAVRRAIADGRLRAFQPTHRVLIREDDARDWIEGRLATPPAPPKRTRPRAITRVHTGRGSVANLKAIERQESGS